MGIEVESHCCSKIEGLLPVEELVKLHFSVKARFSLEAAVVLCSLCFSYRPQAQKRPGKDFFQNL